MTPGPGRERFDGLILVAESPAVIRSGGPWILLDQWAEAGRECFGRATIATPDGTVSHGDLRELAARSTRGRSQASLWRRVVPEPLVTARNDLARLRRARRQAHSVDLRTFVTGYHRPLVVQYHSLFFDRGIALARAIDAPVVLLVDALQVWEAARWGLRRPGWRRVLEARGELDILRRADLLACISDEVTRSLHDAGIPADRTITTPNRAARRFFVDRDQPALRRKLGLAEEDHVVGWIGSFRRFHDLDVLFEAFERVASLDPRAVLVLVGDGPERPAAEKFARKMGADRVRLIGMVAMDSVPEILATFDVGAIPAQARDEFHYSPLKFHELMASGVAVVAPEIGEIAREHAADDALRLYPPGDVAALSGAIEQLLQDDAYRKALGRRARAHEAALGGTAAQLERVVSWLPTA